MLFAFPRSVSAGGARTWECALKFAASGRALACIVLLGFGGACGGRASDQSAVPVGEPEPTACPPSRSAAEVLASDLGTVFDLKVADGEVFWSNGDQVSKVSVCGGPVTTLSTFESSSFTFLAVAGDDVYFTSNDVGISRVPRAGGAVTFVASGAVTFVATAGGFVAWNDGATVERLTIADGSSASFPLRGNRDGSSLKLAAAFALDALAFYWIDLGGSELIRVPFDGGATSDLADAMSSEQGLVVDDQNAYWVVSNAPTSFPAFDSGPPPPSATDSHVYRVSLRGGEVVSLGVGYDFRGPVVDQQRAYWLDAYAGQVQSAPLVGGPVDVLASEEPLESAHSTLTAVHAGPALDRDALYWVTETGELKRIAKTRP